MREKPVMKTRTQFTDYLAEHLGMVRNMKRLSRGHAFFKRWDELMGERWCSVINGRSPTPAQRQTALAERHNVNEIYPLLAGVTRELQVRCHSLHAYICGLPAPETEATGWDLRADLVHPDNTIKMLNDAIDDARSINALDPDNAYYKSLFDQLVEMARWTRTSLNPPPADRAKVNLGAVTQRDLEENLKACVVGVCQSMHDFCELYATVPLGPQVTQMDIGTAPGFEK
ncbi:MAG TPA: hypothetical protein VEA69_25860 [Tepidisphaeraceae bacterium]|nr:hypothetical protein [Tepidisphaeraceae bacterium]